MKLIYTGKNYKVSENLKEVAEKGLKTMQQEKLSKAREQAKAREEQKFNKVEEEKQEEEMEQE